MKANSQVNEDQVRAEFEVLKVVAESVRVLRRVSSGRVYAQLMHAMDLEAYGRMLGVLKNANLIRETEGHELVWIGPEQSEMNCN